MVSPASHQSPLSHDPIKIVIGEKPEEIKDRDLIDAFDHVNVQHVGPKSPLSVDSAIQGINKGSYSLSSSTSKDGDNQQVMAEPANDITVGVPAVAPKPETNSSTNNITFGADSTA